MEIHIRPESEIYKYWKPEEIEKLKELSGKSNFIEISKFFVNRTPISLQKKAIKLGLISNYKFKKYSHDKNYFSIPNSVNCYWAGFFCADGHLGIRNNIILSIQGRDLHHLEKFKGELKFTGNIRTYQRKNYKKKTLKTISTLNMCSCKKIREDLEKNFSITNKKLKHGFPRNIKDNYLKLCFIIGYLDGDGWITFPKGKPNFRIGFVSCNFEILNWIRKQLIKLTGKSNKIYESTKHNYWTYLITGYNALRIFEYLKDFPVPKLDRKWKNPEVLAYLEEIKRKYPKKISQLLFPV